MHFYFDYKDSAGVIIDDDGEDLPSIASARDAAMRYLAEGIRDYSPSELTETLSVLVRTTEVHVMSVSATVQITAATPMGTSKTLS
ncbi:hypothetical protein QRQ56_30975 [Bradyrhizobium sp. U531]|uniref:DUF6894 family protein n=1 Tax=Bradyrhizobium sp. U531 TaxID=3053458 RepID=UPI003F424139